MLVLLVLSTFKLQLVLSVDTSTLYLYTWPLFSHMTSELVIFLLEPRSTFHQCPVLLLAAHQRVVVLPSFPLVAGFPDWELSALAVLFNARLTGAPGVGVGVRVGVGVGSPTAEVTI